MARSTAARAISGQTLTYPAQTSVAPTSGAGDPKVTTRWINVGGLRTRVLQQGSGDHAVLFIHGLGGWAEHWRQAMSAAARAGFMTYAPDLPGFGQSEAPTRTVRYFATEKPYYVRFVSELLDALSVQRVSLVGHSLGGAISVVSAIRNPERVSKLVLVAPGGFGAQVHPRVRMLGLPFASHVARHAPEALIRSQVRFHFHDPTRIPESFLEEAYRYGRTQESNRVAAQLLAFHGVRHALTRSWRAEAKNIKAPALIFWGVQDKTLRLHPRAFEHIPGAQVVTLDPAGHLLMLERPSSFASYMVPFLANRASGQ